MAIYKPSNLSPDLKEIDVELKIGDEGWENNIFEAQVNTTGENVLAYKLYFYQNNEENVYFETPAVELNNSNSGKFEKDGIVNKGTVKTYYDSTDNINPTITAQSNLPNMTTTPANYIMTNKLGQMPTVNSNKMSNVFFRNGMDYQWAIRMYNAPIGNTKQPNTKVCDGILTGSVANVIWTGYNLDNDTERENFYNKVRPHLIYDRYIQFPVPKSGDNANIYFKNPTNLVQDSLHKERIKIDWVEHEVGYNHNITKLELIDSVQCTYIDGTEYEVYVCDNQHTLNSVYADPNSLMTQSYIIALCTALDGVITGSTPWLNKEYTNVIDITHPSPNALAHGVEAFRRIIGISTITGEIRLETPLEKIPNDTYYYALYEYDRNTKKMTQIEGQDFAKQKLGGIPVATGKIMSNRWDNVAKRLFIQPNINIKSDDTNPDELVFEWNGTRMDIKKYLRVNGEDGTFNKLDNTQWLLEGTNVLAPFTSDGVPITTNTLPIGLGDVPLSPGEKYTIYTDFMDSSPNALIYARKTPQITIYFKNLNPDITNPDYVTIESVVNSTTGNTSVPWRDISFITEWTSANNLSTKYYRYTLYDSKGEIIEQSNDIYDSNLTWYFRGFLPKETYTIEIFIEDELNKEFIVSETFKVDYETEQAEAPLEVTYICDKQAFKVSAKTPLYAIQSDITNSDGITTPCVGMSDISPAGDYVEIPDNKVMNYDTVLSEGYPNIALIKPVSFITQFRLHESFIRNIPDGGEKTICEFGVLKTNDRADGYDIYKLTISSFLTFFIDETTNTVIQNTNRLRMKWYKNDNTDPLSCFNNGTATFYDIVAEDPNQEVQLPESLAYALQNNQGKNSSGTTYQLYYFVDVLPNSGYSTRTYVLLEDCVLNGQTYLRGIYKYSAAKGWSLVTNKQYIFAETISQVPGYDMNTFSVPDNCRYTDNNIIMWTDTNNVWLDDFNVAVEASINALKEKWFMSYLVINKDNDGNETDRAYMQMNNYRVEGVR